MARIAGVDLPREKRVEIGLTYIYGIGLPTSKAILEKAGINPDTRVKDLTEEEVGAIRKIIDSDYVVCLEFFKMLTKVFAFDRIVFQKVMSDYL